MRSSSIRSHLFRLLGMAALALGLFPSDAASEPRPTVTIQFLNVSDWHGQLDPNSVFGVGNVGGAAVVGATNFDAPSLVKPGVLGTLEVTDPVPAANKARAAAQAAGAKVTVAIVHMGVTGFDPTTGAPLGPLIDFANNVGGFDVIF